MILILRLLNSLYPERVDTRIKFPVFRVRFFWSKPSYTKHIYSCDTKVHQLKIANFFRWRWLAFFFLQILLLGDRWSIFSIFFLHSLPRLLKWPLSWDCDVTSFIEVQSFSSFIPVSTFKYKPFQTFPIFSFCFQLLPFLSANAFTWIRVHKQFTPHCNKQW